MLKLTLDFPNLAPDVDVNIPGLGTFKNGGSYDISDEKAELFRVVNSVLIDAEDGSVQSKLGPSLKEASDNMHGITVEEVKAPVKAAAKGTPTTEGGDK